MNPTPEPEAGIAEVAARLTDKQRDLLLSVAPSLLDGDYFRPDEGESHAVFAALHRIGIFGRARHGDMPTVYWVQPLGAMVRQHLARAQGED